MITQLLAYAYGDPTTLLVPIIKLLLVLGLIAGVAWCITWIIGMGGKAARIIWIVACILMLLVGLYFIIPLIQSL